MGFILNQAKSSDLLRLFLSILADLSNDIVRIFNSY